MHTCFTIANVLIVTKLLLHLPQRRPAVWCSRVARSPITPITVSAHCYHKELKFVKKSKDSQYNARSPITPITIERALLPQGTEICQ